MDLGAGTPGGLEAHPDLDPLDRLDRHHGLGEPAVEFLVPLRVRAEAEGDALDADLDDAAQSVPFVCRPIDAGENFGVLVGVQGIECALVAHFPLLGESARQAADDDWPDLDHVAEDGDAEGIEQLLGQRAGGDPGGGLPALARSNTPRIEPRCLIEPPRSPWPGRGQANSSSCSIFESLLGISRAMGLPMVLPRHEAAEDFGAIRFEPLPSAAAVAPLAATQFGVDRLPARPRRRRESHRPGPPVLCRAIRRR